MKDISILLVDDDDDDRLLFCDVMHTIDKSIDCLKAVNGKAALELLANVSLLPKMIFLDINMPLMNGFECLAEIKKLKRLAAIPVVMYSTSDDHKAKQMADRLGAVMFITKPSDHKELEAVLRTIFSKYLIVPDNNC